MKLISFSEKKSQQYVLRVNQYYFRFFDYTETSDVKVFSFETDISEDKYPVPNTDIDEYCRLSNNHVYCQANTVNKNIEAIASTYLVVTPRYKLGFSDNEIKEKIYKDISSEGISYSIHHSPTSISPRIPNEIEKITLLGRTCFYHFFGNGIENFCIDVYVLFDQFTLRIEIFSSSLWKAAEDSSMLGKDVLLEFAKKFIEELEIFDSTKVDCSHLKPGVTFIPNEDAEKDITPITDFGW
ncbi:hypothetical protein [Sessilibacter sp. MAH4]